MKIKLTRLILFILPLFWLACSDDDDVSPVTVNFTNKEVGISSPSISTDVSITFSRPTTSAGKLTLAITSDKLTYGNSADFYTQPEAVDQVITLPYNAGDESVSFKVLAGEGLNIQQDESISITFSETSSTLLIGANRSVVLTFSENFVAPSGTVALDAGGENFSHQAFVNLSKLKQTRVDKYSWDLGFYTASGEHRVILNSGAAVMARPLSKTDITQVTAEDTLGFKYEMQTPPPNHDPSIGSVKWVDTPDGNLETTAFGNISSTPSENKVFIIKRDGGRNWQKVRVLQDGDNYTIQYADINATEFNTATISKNTTYNFNFFDLTKGEVSVEPAKDSWDLMYGTYTEVLNLGRPGMNIPYPFKDFIIINRHNTKVAMVMKDKIAYKNFEESDISSVDFSDKINALGAQWRNGGGPSSSPKLYDDRYFIIQNSLGNVFKLQFTRLTSTTGERGKPEFMFERIK